MRIGVKLRALDEKGGVGVYTRNLMEKLLEIDRENTYILFYSTAENLGRFSRYGNVAERAVRAPNTALWDQLAIPFRCWKDQVDVVFHPKFTVPLLAHCKSVMVLHGTGWFTTNFFGTLDTAYMRLFMPLYLRRAARVLSVSEIGVDFYNQKYGIPSGKLEAVHFGPGEQFKRIEDSATLKRAKEKYKLPDRFILNLTKHRDAERKNIRGVLEAYRLLHGRVEHKLVIGGTDCHRFRDEYDIPQDGYGDDILFPGWMDQQDLPAVYSLADVYLYPSFMEAFPIPLTEAMACGTAIVTSDINGLVEVGGDATLQVDPADAAQICQALYRVLTEPGLKQELSAKGLARSELFSWDRCARTTLSILESLDGHRS